MGKRLSSSLRPTALHWILADGASHDLLMDALGCSSLPVVSEEGDSLSIKEDTYWLVDPLDGTKGFGSKQ